MKKIPVRHIAEIQKEGSAIARFSIRDVKLLQDGKDLRQELHRHDFFFILALQKGKGNHEIDFTSYKVSNNMIFFLRPGQVHQLYLKAGCSGYLLEFNSGFYQQHEKTAMQQLRTASNKNVCQLAGDHFEKLQAVLTNIFQEYTEKQEGYQDIIKANLDIFFIELLRQRQGSTTVSTNANSYTQERLEEFVSLLEMHIANYKQVVQYTELMNLSAYQLNEITKATIGKTASSLISEHIILEAKRYLLATPNQIKEIADQLGYEDVSYFIRFFKKQTGFTPEQFRDKCR